MRKSRCFGLALGCVCLILGVSQIASAQQYGNEYVGTWKLDTAKSDLGKMPAPKSQTLTITSSSDASMKWKFTRVDHDGKVLHQSYAGAVDDKQYPLAGDPDGATFAFLKSGGWESKDKSGKVVMTGKSSLSDDGKTFTDKVVHKTPDGDVNTTEVYQKVK